MTAVFRLELLGAFALREQGGAVIAVKSRKVRALLGYLALNPDRRHEREKLANFLWGDRFDAQARQSLRQALLTLRQLLGERAIDVFAIDNEAILLHGAALHIDVSDFENDARDDELERACTIYRGEFLEGIQAGSETYELWLGGERTRLHDLACEVWQKLGTARLESGEAPGAIEAATRLVALDPLRESGHRLLMRSFAAAGRRAEAMQHFRKLGDSLQRELGIEPDPETTRLVDEIRKGARPAPPGTANASADKPSIAVLPFANRSADAEQEYFADGISEDIMTALSKFDLFSVISRNSTFTYRGDSADVKDIARDLGVQYVLKGSVRKSAARLRITAQLIDAAQDRHIWAENYDRDLADIFDIQDEISQAIVTSVAPEFLTAEMQRAQKKEAQNLDAWDSFMLGYWHFLRFTQGDNAAAQHFVSKAIALDQNQANYHGMLATTHVMDAVYGWSTSREASLGVALVSAERGLALDDQDAMVIRSAGLVHFFSKNHDAALNYYQRAVAVNPNEAENRSLLGAALGVAGDYEAAREQFEEAFRLSPRDSHIAIWYNYLALAAFIAGRDTEAVAWAQKTIQANPTFPGGPRTLAASCGNLGQIAEAVAARQKLQELQPHVSIAQLRESLPYFKEADTMERYLEGLRKAGLPEGGKD